MISFLGMTKPKQGMINPHPLSAGDGLPALMRQAEIKGGDKMKDMIGKVKTAKTFWVYTSKGEEKWKEIAREKGLDPTEKKAGEAVHYPFTKTAPLLWVVNGWIEEAKE